MPLDPAHVKALVEERGIERERAERMFESLHDPKACAKLVGLPVELFVENVPAIVIRYHFPFAGREHQDVRLRPARPVPMGEPKKNGKRDEAKYLGRRGAPPRVYYSSAALDNDVWLSDTSVDLILTEGEFKAESAASAGFIALAVPGVTQWHNKGSKRLHSDFAHIQWDGRRVNVCFDRDSQTNANVKGQEEQLSKALILSDARVHIVRFPADAPKLDDCLVKHGRAYVARLFAETPEYKLPSPEPVNTPMRGEALTDLGNAERLVLRFGSQLRFCGKWLVWNGSRWGSDETGEVHRLAQRAVRELYAKASEMKDNDQRTALVDHARKSESRARLDAMIALAATQPEVASRASDFDRDPWLLNTPSGTLNLRTGECAPHSPADLITRITRTSFDAQAKCPRWEKFVLECMSDSAELAAYIQRAIGYALTGDISEHCLFFCYGGGANGKSTLINTLMRLLGDYARPGAPDLLLEKRGESHPTEQADLAGARLVSVQEVGEGRAWADATLKSLTGGDPIKARRMREDFWTFEPTHKFFVSGNFKPRVHGADDGVWRRMRLVPFEVSFKGREDKKLAAELESETSGILAWAVRGCLEWQQKRGLAEPERVNSQTQAYRRESDGPREFIRTRCHFDAKDVAKATRCTEARRVLRGAYEEWSVDRGEIPVGAKRFAETLRACARSSGIELADSSKRLPDVGKVVDAWAGVRLKSDSEIEAQRLEDQQHAEFEEKPCSEVVMSSEPDRVSKQDLFLKSSNPAEPSTSHYATTSQPDNDVAGGSENGLGSGVVDIDAARFRRHAAQ